MRSLRFIALIIVVLGFLFAVFFYRTGINVFFARSREVIAGFFDGTLSYGEFLRLKTENEGLKAALAEKGKMNDGNGKYMAADIYSRYPFNDRRVVIVNRGSRDGVKIGMPVLASENILLGKIVGVRETQATVETIFDPEWRESVVLGDKSLKALLKGGLPPTLELIDEKTEIAEGDKVLNLSPEYPFHVFLGTVGKSEPVTGGAWQRARLEASYELDNLNQVLIIVNFP